AARFDGLDLPGTAPRRAPRIPAALQFAGDERMDAAGAAIARPLPGHLDQLARVRGVILRARCEARPRHRVVQADVGTRECGNPLKPEPSCPSRNSRSPPRSPSAPARAAKSPRT